MLRDFLGENILMEPLSLCMNFVLSAGGATIMGILGAKSVINQFITQDWFIFMYNEKGGLWWKKDIGKILYGFCVIGGGCC